MPTKYIGMMLFIYMMAIIFSSMATGADMFANANITDPVQATQVYGIQQYQTDFITITNPTFSPSYLVSLWKVLTLDFPFWEEGPWIVLRWIILGPIIAIVVFGMVQLFSGTVQRNV